ncbi:MAG: SNF2 helicase associated domain-containing protein [Blautia sp.]
MLKLSVIRDNCFPSTYTKGRQLYESQKYKSYRKTELSEGDILVEASIKGSGSRWYEVSITIGEEDGEEDIIDYVCDCPAYESYFGLCKHCVALALLYREKQKQDFAAMNIQKGMAGFTGKNKKAAVETSRELKEVMSRCAMQKNGRFLGEYYQQIQIEPVITKERNMYFIEFRIGAGKMYVLKNICKLLDDIAKEKYSAYGKNLGFTHTRSAFAPEALKWIDFISEYLRARYTLNFEDQIYSSNFRRIALSPYGMDKMFQMMMGERLEIQQKKYRIIQGNPCVQAEILSDGEEETQVTIHTDEWIQGVEHNYFVKDDTICQCTEDFERIMMPVLRGLILNRWYGNSYYRREEVFYLNKEDYTAFCGNLLPVLEQYAEVNIQNIDFEEYMPQEAEFCVYLSQDEKHPEWILAKAEAVYGTASYNLFDDPDPSSQYRNLEKESVLESCLKKYFFYEKNAGQVYGICSTEEQAYALFSEGMAKLHELCNLYVDEKLRRMRVIPSPVVNVGVGIQSDLLKLDIRTEGIDYGEMDKILSAYKRRKKYYRMKNGDFVSLENEGLSLVSELAESLDITGKELKEGSITVPKYRASYIAETLKKKGENVKADRSPEFKKLVRDMNSYEDSDFEVPAELHADLRTYQQNGFRWLAMLASWGFGGILADDMGLGKTLQVIALLELKKEGALIVCPASLVYNWESEIHRFAPDLSVRLITGAGGERKEQIETAGEKDILVTSYDLLKRDKDVYKSKKFSYMIIDEAQYIKNAGTQSAKAVKEIRAVHRFALTGTPVENRLSDLWSIFDFIMPGYLHAYGKFKKELEIPIVKNEDEVICQRLGRMTAPFILRRKKQDVLKDLPDKLEKNIYVKMDGEQRRLYDAKIKQIQMELSGESEEDYNHNKLKYLAELTNLRQICCSPDLCYENYTGQSAKTEACLEIVEDMIQAEHRILLFSQFTRMLDILAANMERKGISYLYLSGKNSKEQRKDMVKKFQEGNVQVFLISLKAGGTGLNLTQADVVIHYDPWWNVAAQNQATDRTHRIGQKNMVTVVKLVTKDTIEEKILALQEKKARLAENIVEGQGVADYRISKEELMELMEG